MALVAEDLAAFFDDAERDAPVHFIVDGNTVKDGCVYMVRHYDFDGDYWVEVKINTEPSD